MTNDLICYDMYHIMACPEWEECDIDISNIDQHEPKWFQQNLQGYVRPTWFAQGPQQIALQYLIAKNSPGIVNFVMSKILWNELCIYSNLIPKRWYVKLSIFIYTKFARVRIATLSPERLYDALHKVIYKILKYYRPSIYCARLLSGLILFPYITWKSIIRKLSPAAVNRNSIDMEIDLRIDWLLNQFKLSFPDRIDQLKREDVSQYFLHYSLWKKLFSFYDVVIGYSTDGIYPLIASKDSFVAFEHGTIRDIPFEDSAIGRIAALVYSEAKVTYMTNADSIEQAKLLKAKNIIYGLHGFNDKVIVSRQSKNDSAFDRRIKSLQGKKIFFAPARQHWVSGFPSWRKGNDLIIRAAQKVKKEFPDQFHIIFVEWGNDVENSKDLIKNLNMADCCTWIKPLSKSDLLQAYAKVDCVIDQFTLPCIGSITLEAVAQGCPVITALNDESITEFYGEKLELLNCTTVDQIASAMTNVLNNDKSIQESVIKSSGWFKKYHTKSLLLSKLIAAIELAQA